MMIHREHPVRRRGRRRRTMRQGKQTWPSGLSERCQKATWTINKKIKSNRFHQLQMMVCITTPHHLHVNLRKHHSGCLTFEKWTKFSHCKASFCSLAVLAARMCVCVATQETRQVSKRTKASPHHRPTLDEFSSLPHDALERQLSATPRFEKVRLFLSQRNQQEGFLALFTTRKSANM